eukprot:m.116515 g.116515  ORF g.116515 m.116515 type:complete len:1339 (-) comp12854_c0_seq1:67-4083(-)
MGVGNLLMRVVRASTTSHSTTGDGGGHTTEPSTGVCSEEAEAAGVILFIFFGLAMGVFTRQVIQYFKIPIPYTVCLLLLGVAWGAITTGENFGFLDDASCIVSDIDPALLLLIFLPLLVFESAFSLDYHAFKGVVFPALILAIPGLLMSIFVTGAVVHEVILPGEFDWNSSFLLGTILSATDPVAVVALLKELGGPPQLATLIESESLLNDGTAIVAFEIFLELAAGAHLTGEEGVKTALQLSLGGPALGLLWGVVTIFWIGRIIDDDLSEVTVTLLSAYLLFFVAEDVCHVSAVLALVVLGVCFAAYGKTRISPHSEHSTHTFWRILTYHGNTLIFVFVGLVLVLNNDFEHISGRDWGFVFILWAFLYLIRVAMMVVFALPLRWVGFDFGWKDGLVAAHGGLRGAVSLALALSVSLGGGHEGSGEGIPDVVQSKTLFYVGGCAFLTLVVNASTTSFVLQKLGLVKEHEAQQAVYAKTREKIAHAIQKTIASMAHDNLFSMANWDQVKSFLSLPEDDSIEFQEGTYKIAEQMNEEMDDKMRDNLGVLHDLHNNDIEFDNDNQQQKNDVSLHQLFAGRAEKPLSRLRSVKADIMGANAQSTPFSMDGVDVGEEEEDEDFEDGLVLNLARSKETNEDINVPGKRRKSYLSDSFSEARNSRFFSVKYGTMKKRKSMDSMGSMPLGFRDHLLRKKIQRRASKFSSAELQNSRLRLLTSTRAIYWELFESGFLSREVVQVLVDSAEESEEVIKHDSSLPLNDWSERIRSFVSRPWYLRLLQSHSWLCLDVLRQKLERYIVIRHAAGVVNLCDVFIAAHRKTLADLSGAIAEVAQNKRNVNTLVTEATLSMNQAKLVLRSLPDAVVSAVRSKQAAALLVTKQEHLINEKMKHGVLTAIESENLLKHIRLLRGKLVLHAPKFSFPDPRTVLRWSRLFDNLDPAAAKATAKCMKIITRRRGDIVVRAGDPVDGLYVLVRGFVSLFVPSFDRKAPPKFDLGSTSHNYLSAGAMLAAIETVSGAKGVVSVVVTSSNAQLLHLPYDKAEELMEKFPKLRRNLYRVCAYHLLFQKRHKAFSVAGRVFPPARNIAHAPFGIQEDLWPFAQSGTMERVTSGQHIVIGVAGIVVKGLFLGIKESKLHKNSIHHVASHVFSTEDDIDGHDESTSLGSSDSALNLRHGGLPSCKNADKSNPSIMHANHLRIPISSDECTRVADVSETISSAITTRHLSRRAASVTKENVKFDSKVYKPFAVVKSGEYICKDDGLLFVIGPNTVQNTDVFDAFAEEETDEENDRHTGVDSSDSETDGETAEPSPNVSTSKLHNTPKIITFTSDGDLHNEEDIHFTI